MNFDQLKYFVSISDTLNYSRSSQLLNVTQPALSLSISRMEEEIGFPLFVKKGRNIELSLYGERFYGYANTILNNMNIALSELQSLADDSLQSISLALNICFNYDYINEILVSFEQHFPYYKPDVMIMDFSDILPALQQNSINFAITHQCKELAGCGDLECVPLAEYPLYAFMSADNPLADKSFISVDMLNESNLFVNTFKFKQRIQESNPPLYNAQTVTVVADYATMVRMVAEGKGVMTGNFTLSDEMRALNICRIPYAHRTTKYALVWNKNRVFTSADSCLKNFVIDYVKKNPLKI